MSKFCLYEPLAKAPFRVCAVPNTKLAGKRSFRLQQAQLVGTCYRFGPTLNL